MGASFWRQLRGVLWKNLLLKKANLASTLFEVRVVRMRPNIIAHKHLCMRNQCCTRIILMPYGNGNIQ